MKIEIESEALDSLKAMAQRLQEERYELLDALIAFRDGWPSGGKNFEQWHRSYGLAIEKALTIVAKCTAKPAVLE